MQMRIAAVNGFHEFIIAKNQYLLTNCDSKLIEKYINTFVIITSPIIPHFAEHVWKNIMKKDKMIWPKTTMKKSEIIILLKQEKLINYIVNIIKKKKDVQLYIADRKVTYYADISSRKNDHKELIKFIKTNKLNLQYIMSNLDKFDNWYNEYEFVRDNLHYLETIAKCTIHLCIDNNCVIPRLG